MAEITDEETLWAWLAARPHADAVLIAARAALRVVPALATALDDAEACDAIIMPSLRTCAAPWIAAVGPTQSGEVRRAANSASAHATADAVDAAAAAANAGRAAADAANAAADAGAAAFAARAAYSAAQTARIAPGDYDPRDFDPRDAAAADRALWQAVERDAIRLEEGTAHEALAAAPLWPDGPPAKIVEAWQALSKAVLAADPGWWVWTDWYQARLDGRPFDKALEEARVLIPDETWEQGSGAVNARIAELIEEHGIRATPVARPLTIDGAGNIATTPPAPRPDVPEGIGHASLVENACEKLRDHSHYLRDQRRWDRFSALQRYLDRIDALLAEPSLRPDRLHDAFEAAAQAIPRLLSEDELPDAVETHDLRNDLLSGAADLRHLYPDLAAMVAARRTAATPALTPEQVEAFDRMLAAVEEIVARELKEELAEDVEAMREAVADPPPEARKLPLPDGPLKARVYRLLAYLTRIKRLASVSGTELIKHLDKGVEAAKKIESYRKAAAAIEPYWQLVLRAIRELLSGGGGNGAM